VQPTPALPLRTANLLTAIVGGLALLVSLAGLAVLGYQAALLLS